MLLAAILCIALLVIVTKLSLGLGLQAIYRQGPDQQDYTPAAAAIAGDIAQLGDGRASVIKTDLAASQKGSVYTEGIFDVISATGTLFAAGEEVWWDTTGKLAVKIGTTAIIKLGTAVAAKISGDLVVRVDLNSTGDGAVQKVASILAASAAVTTTVTETVVATYTIPANSLKTGSILEFFAQLIATATNSTDTFRFLVRIGGVAGSIVADTTAIDLANNDVGVMSGQIVIRTDGASGTLVAGSQSMLKTTANPVALGSTAIDTTVGTVTLVVTIVESVSSAGNSARCDIFNVFQK